MTPPEFRQDVVASRLSSLRRILSQLKAHQERVGSADYLLQHPVELYGVYYMMAQIVDLATSINQHISLTVLGVADSDDKRGFENLSRAGVLPSERVAEFHASAAMRNVIVHQYTEVDARRVIQAVPKAVELYSLYAKKVADWVIVQSGSDPTAAHESESRSGE